MSRTSFRSTLSASWTGMHVRVHHRLMWWAGMLIVALGLMTTPGLGGTAAAFEPSEAHSRIGASTNLAAAAVDISQALFADGAATHVVLGRDDVFADTLAGAALAGDAGPLLFTTGGRDARLLSNVQAEIERVLGPSSGCGQGTGRVFLLGGESAVSSDVETAIRSAGYCVERFGGASRVETAVAIAERVHDGGGQVLLARADLWADAATGGAYAAATGSPILVTYSTYMHPAVETFLRSAGTPEIVLLGGHAALNADVAQAARQHGSVKRVAGEARDGTAVAIATELWGSLEPREVIVLNGYADTSWGYAFASAPFAATRGAPQLYATADALSPTTRAFLEALDFRIVTTVGPASLVSAAVRAEAEGFAIPGPVYVSETRLVQSNGCCWDAAPAKVNATSYARSLTMSSTDRSGWREYDLSRRYDRMRGTVGVRDDSTAGHRRQFDVFVDGELRFSQQVGLGEAVDFDVDVSDALRLRVSTTVLEGSGTGVFANPRLLAERAEDTPGAFTDTPEGPPLQYVSETGVVQSNGCCWDAEPANVDGTSYARSLTMSSTDRSGWREYDLSRRYDRMRGTVGVRDDSTAGHRRQFDVFVDGELRFSQQVGLGEAVDFDVDVSDALRLRVSTTVLEGSGTGVFGDPRVLRTGASDEG